MLHRLPSRFLLTILVGFAGQATAAPLDRANSGGDGIPDTDVPEVEAPGAAPRKVAQVGKWVELGSLAALPTGFAVWMYDCGGLVSHCTMSPVGETGLGLSMTGFVSMGVVAPPLMAAGSFAEARALRRAGMSLGTEAAEWGLLLWIGGSLIAGLGYVTESDEVSMFGVLALYSSPIASGLQMKRNRRARREALLREDMW